MQRLFQSQVPDQPVQVIRMHPENPGRLHVISPRLFDRIKNQLLLPLFHAGVILALMGLGCRRLLQ